MISLLQFVRAVAVAQSVRTLSCKELTAVKTVAQAKMAQKTELRQHRLRWCLHRAEERGGLTQRRRRRRAWSPEVVWARAYRRALMAHSLLGL